jgi:hypothetical protein
LRCRVGPALKISPASLFCQAYRAQAGDTPREICTCSSVSRLTGRGRNISATCFVATANSCAQVSGGDQCARSSRPTTCAPSDPSAARRLVDGGFRNRHEYALQTLRENSYDNGGSRPPRTRCAFMFCGCTEIGFLKSRPTEDHCRGHRLNHKPTLERLRRIPPLALVSTNPVVDTASADRRHAPDNGPNARQRQALLTERVHCKGLVYGAGARSALWTISSEVIIPSSNAVLAVGSQLKISALLSVPWQINVEKPP